MNDNKLVEIIYDTLAKINTQKDNPNQLKFYPSEVGKCSRAIVYRMLNRQRLPLDPRIYSIFDNGTAFHERMEELFSHTDILIANELIIKDEELKVSGRSDIIIKNPYVHKPSNNIIKLYHNNKIVWEGPDNDAHIIELKSISESGFKYIIKAPKEEHIWQLQLYMYMTGIRGGTILYENKNNQRLVAHVIKYNPTLVKKIIQKIKDAITNAEANKIPPQDYEENSYECRYCDFAHICRPKSFYSREIIDLSDVNLCPTDRLPE